MPSSLDDWFFIVNPIANSGRLLKRWNAFTAHHQKSLNQAFTKSSDSVVQLVEQALTKGYRHLAAVGGDGSLHDLINALHNQTLVPSKDLTFGLIPMGSGNDWSRTHKLPSNPNDALKVLETGTIKAHNVGLVKYEIDGEVKQRYFINALGAGFDAFVVHRGLTNKSILVLNSIFKYKPVAADLTLDGKRLTNKWFSINIGIGNYSGGGMSITPHSNFQSENAGITLIEAISPFRLARNVHLLFNKKILTHKRVQGSQAKKIKIESTTENQIPVEADGEFLGYNPIEIEILQNAINVMLPNSKV